MDLSSRVIVITGASTGLGAGMATWFASAGAALGLCARRIPDPPHDRTVSRSVDVTDKAALEGFASEVSSTLGPIDLWINNAAVLEPVVAVRKVSWTELERHLTINVGGVLHGTQVFLERLDADGHRGALINISSGVAQRGRAGLAAYSASKAAVDRLTEVVAAEEKDLLTMALAVSPGVVETRMQATIRNLDESVFPDVELFRSFQREGVMNSPGWVAAHIAEWVFGGSRPEGVIVRVPREADQNPT
ncbi:MAG TPA: SDR family NAD(P)-dependent oxidoreductase [Acidimicrobiia bacterium]|nr:SDR family NAD(P)-dependent oxidoreductase [Acidimicrobiia bacterium]